MFDESGAVFQWGMPHSTPCQRFKRISWTDSTAARLERSVIYILSSVCSNVKASINCQNLESLGDRLVGIPVEVNLIALIGVGAGPAHSSAALSWQESKQGTGLGTSQGSLSLLPDSGCLNLLSPWLRSHEGLYPGREPG